MTPVHAITGMLAVAAAIALGGMLPRAGATPACADGVLAPGQAAGWTTPVVERADGTRLDMDALVDRLAQARVVFVGEIHDRYDHHLNQLEIVCRLRVHGPLAIGLEFFQTPAQPALDAYVYDHGDLQRLLRESEWFTRWGFDPRLYAPILRFAHEHRIPLVALNVPGELVRAVARNGLDGLDAGARARLPASIQDGPPAYRERLQQVFAHHPGAEQRSFRAFLDAQLLWDEGMAQRAAEFLLEQPRHRLVVLAGEGHVAYGDAIPDRLSRRVDAPRALVLQSHDHSPALDAADYRIVTTERALPRAGLLGVRVGGAQEPDAGDGVAIVGFAESSAARDAGLAEGDRLISVDGTPVRVFADLRLALWRKAPGDAVTLAVERGGRTEHLTLALR